MFLAEFAKKKKEEKRVTLRDRIVGTTNAGKAFRVGALASGAGLAALAYNKRGSLGGLRKNPWETVKNYYTTDAGKSTVTTNKSRTNTTTRTVKDNSERVNTKTKTTTVPESRMDISSKKRNRDGSYSGDLEKIKTHTKTAGKQGVDQTKQNNKFDRDYSDVKTNTDNTTTTKDSDARSFINTGKKVNWGRIGKTAGITGGALAIPTGAAYIAGNKKDKEDIEKRIDGTFRRANKTSKQLRSWVNTLHRVSR